MKKCPYCAEEIQEDAKKCKHCGEWLNKGIERKHKYDTNLIKPPPLPKVETSVSTTSNKVKGKPWYKQWWAIAFFVIIFLYIVGIAAVYDQGGVESIKNKNPLDSSKSFSPNKATKSKNSSKIYTKPSERSSAQDIGEKFWSDGHSYGVILQNEGSGRSFTPCNNYAKNYKYSGRIHRINRKDLELFILKACLMGFSDSK